MALYLAELPVTYKTFVTVSADSEEDAAAKIKDGNFLVDDTLGVMDWGDPTNVTLVEELNVTLVEE